MLGVVTDIEMLKDSDFFIGTYSSNVSYKQKLVFCISIVQRSREVTTWRAIGEGGEDYNLTLKISLLKDFSCGPHKALPAPFDLDSLATPLGTIQ